MQQITVNPALFQTLNSRPINKLSFAFEGGATARFITGFSTSFIGKITTGFAACFHA
jgi:hypothetical protein